MAEILVKNLDPLILERLETLAKQHGRSLEEELKHILQQACETVTPDHIGADMEKAREAALQIRKQLAGHIHTNSIEIIREDRER